VLIGRRLVLILLYTFVNDALVRLLAMLFFCFVVLLHHVDVQPYRHRVGNIAGTFSATALVTLGTVNLVRYEIHLKTTITFAKVWEFPGWVSRPCLLYGFFVF